MYLEKEFEVSKGLVIKAGQRIMEIYENEDFNVDMKSDNSPLTKADLEANEIIVKGLKENFPRYSILTEEDADDLSRLENEYVWIIDPIDGTKEFIKKNGEFTINVALVKDEEPVLGMVYSPAIDELFYAVKGNGAFEEIKEGKREITVSDNSRFEEMNLSISRSHAGEKEQKIIPLFKNTVPKGSSLKGCLIANGTSDVYFRFGNTHEWDICAMTAVLIEAGGKITDLEGNKIRFNQENTLLNGFVASNNKNHEELVSLAK
ncbi:3'(2'),5'-bisphosphate nucleotidase [Candidatus Woesearchaeota archaeon]|nr:MAG: 3'(2'),5'-bisphosphate nucleotidase [Candidatus Woesearchaeota archaeon]